MPKLRLLLTAAVAASLLAGSPPAQAQTVPADLAAFVAAAQASGTAPGVAASVFSADETLGTSACGVRRAGAPDALEAADRLHIGSLTKAVTATTLARLVESGALSWSSRPARMFPELRASLRPRYRTITLAQLLSHRANVAPWEDGGDIPALAGTPRAQRYAATRRLLRTRPTGRRGSFVYSNGGYAIAAAMAERVTRRSWEGLVRTQLLRPLGIRGVFGWPAEVDPAQPFGHVETAAGLQPIAPADYALPSAIAPAGDLSLTPAGYARFGRLHLAALRGRPRLLSEAGFARLHRPVGDYALGWIVQAGRGARVYAHEGTTGTFHAIVVLVPARDRGVVAIANAGGERAAATVRELAFAALGVGTGGGR